MNKLILIKQLGKFELNLCSPSMFDFVVELISFQILSEHRFATFT